MTKSGKKLGTIQWFTIWFLESKVVNNSCVFPKKGGSQGGCESYLKDKKKDKDKDKKNCDHITHITRVFLIFFPSLGTI